MFSSVVYLVLLSPPHLPSVNRFTQAQNLFLVLCAISHDAARNNKPQVLGVLDKSRRAQACLDLLAAFLRALPRHRHTTPPTGRGSARSATTPPPPPPPPPPVMASPASSAPGEREDGRSKSGSGDGGGEERGAVFKGEVELAQALVGVAKLLHDSFDLLSSGERQRQASCARGGG